MVPVESSVRFWDGTELFVNQLIYLQKMSIIGVSHVVGNNCEIITHFLLVGTFLELMFPFFRAANRSSTGAITIRRSKCYLVYLHAE